MLDKLAALLLPFSVIARELTILRELYEMELAEKHIYRVTEKPRPGDTQVTYAGDEENKNKAVRKFLEDIQEEIDADGIEGEQDSSPEE